MVTKLFRQTDHSSDWRRAPSLLQASFSITFPSFSLSLPAFVYLLMIDQAIQAAKSTAFEVSGPVSFFLYHFCKLSLCFKMFLTDFFLLFSICGQQCEQLDHGY